MTEAHTMRQDYGKWHVVRPLGNGAQGQVFLVFDASNATVPLSAFKCLDTFPRQHVTEYFNLVDMTGASSNKPVQLPLDLVSSIVEVSSVLTVGALKVLLHDGRRDREVSIARFQREIGVLRSVQHPGLVTVLDWNEHEGWFVAPYFQSGALSSSHKLYEGRPREALRALRPLVEGVALLHEKGFVHRDIKPQNIFLAADRSLVLGDLGIVHAPTDAPRLTGTYENVGTRDWMPPWTIARRDEDVRPSVDVFALGKILWALVAGVATCPSEYTNCEIAAACEDKRAATLIEDIVRSCVVPNEQDCVKNAGELLTLIDDVIRELDLRVPTNALRLAAHSYSRPGGPCLFSVEWPARCRSPVFHPTGTLFACHPAAQGFSPGIGSDQRPVLLRDDNWEANSGFRKLDKKSQFNLLTLPRVIHPTFSEGGQYIA